MLVSVDGLNKKINDKIIVQNGTFSIEEQDKIALIGTNGTGKSTLMKILAGIETYDTGTIIKKNGIKISYLAQNPVFKKETVWEEANYINSLNKEPLEDYEMKSILTKLGLLDFDMKIAHMSGGQRKRLALSCALLVKCDLLMLDEPTNHLDDGMIEWLENYLQRLKCALFMVTHDRYFLNNICTRIFELDLGSFYEHKGNYEVYLENKEIRIAQQELAAHKHKQLFKQELAWVRAGCQARSTKQKSRLDRFEELRKTRFAKQEEALELAVVSQRLGKKTIEWENLGFGYTNELLFHDFSYNLLRHDRVGIIGENGCGKSTLLSVIHRDLKPSEGTIEYGDTVRIGFFRQGDQMVDTSMRLIDYIEEVAQVIQYNKQTLTAAQMLERFLFPKTMHYITIDRLSGGERRRLYLCRVLMQAPNILLLDEPTNDLDILTLDVLEDYLDSFPGAIITVSHDRYFLDRVCDKVFVHQTDNTFKQYPGGYSDYKIKAGEEESVQVKVTKTTWKQPKKNGLTYMEKKELVALSEEMESLEVEIEELNAQMNEVGSDFEKLSKITEERDAKEERLEEVTLRWMELEEKKEG